MALPYHTHTFVLPTATKRDVENATRSDLVVVPNSLGSMASKDESQYATAEQGEHADDALNWIDETGRGFEGAIQQFIDNGFPSYITDKPYSLGSYVRYTSGSSGTGVYRSKKDNNTSAPNTENWERIQSLAFKDKIVISDINAGGVPDNQSYLRGDGQWSSVAALVDNRDSFVVSTGGPFPEDGEWVVYAMNGLNAPANPGSAYWYELGFLNETRERGTPNQFLNGLGQWIDRGNVGAINTNGNAGQYLNGQGNWATPPQPQPTGYWVDIETETFEDENIRVKADYSNNYANYDIYYKKSCRLTGLYYGDDNLKSNRINAGSSTRYYVNLVFIHIDGLDHHYQLSANRIFVDKR